MNVNLGIDTIISFARYLEMIVMILQLNVLDNPTSESDADKSEG